MQKQWNQLILSAPSRTHQARGMRIAFACNKEADVQACY